MFRYALLVVLGILCACGAAQAQFSQALKFMGATVMPNSNIVFSVGKQAPKTDVEWVAVLNSAANLSAGALKLMPMGPDTGREAWVNFTDALGVGSRKAVAAAKTRNVDAVLSAGDAIYEACEGCHTAYMKK
jgi:cytochrome c556